MSLFDCDVRRIRVCAATLFVFGYLVAGGSHVHADSVASDVRLSRFELKNSLGANITDADLEEGSCVVIAFLGTECPLAKLYAATLSDLHERYQSRGVSFLAVMSNRQDSLEEIAAFERRTELPFPVGKDLGNRFADALAAQRTPEVFLFDSQRGLRYRGRIDDQYGIGTILDRPRRNDLREAIDEVLAGKPVSVPQTDAVGCLIGRRKSLEKISSDSAVQKEGQAITYHEHIAPILSAHCVDCHREGEIGPFVLNDYDEVAGWADMIVETTREGRMPPWHAGPLSTATFRNERKLSDEELGLLERWADSGAEEGEAPVKANVSNPAELAVIEDVRDENGRIWELPRQPDYVFPITDKPVSIPASGEVKYRYFRVDPGFEEDVWVSAMQLRPGNRSVVHHILVFARQPGTRTGLHAQRGFLDGYVPGYRVEPFAPGYAKRIPAGSELIFQVHYTPTGSPQEDLSEFAIVRATESEITHEVRTDSVLQTKLAIPPGESNYQVTAYGSRLPKDAELLALMPHMHVRGKSFRYELQSARSWWSSNESASILLDVPHYDFNWQTSYVLAEPLKLPNGGRFIAHATYDNSEKNLSNPDPTQTVRWGDQTWEEMMIGYYHYAVRR
ncbi:redoxin domain-containing protein [Aporhodopirellula aestuarii]|uniref:Redoxin domain-containing protein n=1 Tax=Aporhodopirellula aestuarii TaxID=2950107 RepID=A0ABT0U539_9BACT|nr:redoxin domain-containing protein [Aporhodopirellula aestuarii]MCM2372027.1 redoxin domain-containing protein [Aporhodopirellula aestuarii]